MLEKTRFVLMVLAIILLIPTPAQAQQWSAEEREVLDHVEVCFDSFTEASEQKDLQIWIQRCRPTEGSLYWVAPNAGPIDLEGLQRDWEIRFQNSKRMSSTGFEPMRIRLVGDMAFVYGYSWWYNEPEEGDLQRYHDKRLEIYRKQSDQWGLESIVWLPVATE